MTYYLSWLKCRIMLYAPFFPGWSGWFKLSLSGKKKKKKKDPAGQSAREQLICWTCGVWVGESVQPAIGPVLLLPRQRVREGGINVDLLSHLLLKWPRLTNRLLLCVQLRSDRRDRFTYANDMEMTQTRGHADRFHFSSWAKSQSGASFGHSAGILPHYITRTMMPDLWHVSSSLLKAQSAVCFFFLCRRSCACKRLLKDTSAADYIWTRGCCIRQ